MNKGKISKLEDKVKKATNSGEWAFIEKVGDKPYTYNGEEFDTVEEIKEKYNLPEKSCMVLKWIIGKGSNN
jgi:hypothetical protein